MSWRKLVRVLHRDIGYAAVALTLAYGLSGIAVNHVEDWNPNYSFEDIPVDVGPLPTDSYDAMQAHVVEQLAIDPTLVKGRFMETETEFRVFLPEGQEVSVDVRDGTGLHKKISTHPVVYEVNALHLNNLRGWWTWIADVFAVSLMVLALTGLVMIKGKRGLAGRGKWFVGAGLLVPVGAVVYMYWGG